MATEIIIALIAAGILVGAFVVNRARRREVSSPAGRLGKLIAQRPDYQIFVGVPFATPKEWATATRQGENTLNVQGFGVLRVNDVRAFAVAYTNGQLLDCEPYGLPLPANLSGLTPTSQADSGFLRLDDLEPGKAYIQVTHGPSATRQRDPSHYTTTLKNISAERVRVRRFAAFSQSMEGWRLSTITRQFYSTQEFCEWYGLGSGKWIEPGQAVTDPNNYGSPPVLWAYYCESESGKQFIAGRMLA